MTKGSAAFSHLDIHAEVPRCPVKIRLKILQRQSDLEVW